MRVGSSPTVPTITIRSVSHDEESQGISNHAETQAKDTSTYAKGQEKGMIVASDCYIADLLAEAPKGYTGSQKWIAIRNIGNGCIERAVRDTPFKAAKALHESCVFRYGITDTLIKFRLQHEETW